MAERIRTRFLVVGSGVAGLHTAWRASTGGDVTVVTKRSLFDSATAYAQGGIAAALGAGRRNPSDVSSRRRCLDAEGGSRLPHSKAAYGRTFLPTQFWMAILMSEPHE